MDPKESVKQKLERFQRTQELTNQIRFNRESQPYSKLIQEPTPGAAPQSTTSFRIIQAQTAISRNDMDFIRTYIQTLSELDPANPYYTNLLKRNFIPWEELQEIVDKFSENHSYLVRMQDEINNLRLAAAKEEAVEIVEPEAVTDQPVPEQTQQQEEQAQEQHEERREESGYQAHREPPPRYIISSTNRQPALEKSADERQALKEKMKASPKVEIPPEKRNAMPERSSRQNKISSKTRKLSKEAEDRQKKQAAANILKPSKAASGGWNPLGDWLGGKLAQSRFVQPALKALEGLTERLGLNPVLNGLKALNNLLEWPERMLGRLAGQLGRGALNLASNLIRGALNLGARALAQLLPRLGLQAGLQAGRSLLMGAGSIGAALVTTGALTILVGVIVIIAVSLGILWLYNDRIANSECNKPAGEMRVEKRITNSLDSNDPSIRNEDPEIRYLIEMSYELLCKNRKLETVTVTDKIPEGVRYDPDHPTARSGFRNDDSSGPEGIYDPTTKTLTWTFTNFPTLSPVYIYFNTQRETTDSWAVNEATVKYTVSGPLGGFSDITGLLPNPLTSPPANWESIKSQILAAFNKHPELLDIYKQASAQSGIPWQVLAGLHFVETGSGPGPDSSLVSGRKIGQAEPDISPAKCAAGVSGPGIPIPIGGGCGFSTQADSAIYAANHLAEKIGKVPSAFSEVVEALSKYNGGGNANCGEGLSYGPCPPQLVGEDDPYAMADFDEAHSSSKMYVIFCGDGRRCNPPEIFKRPGAMGVVRALIEEGL